MSVEMPDSVMLVMSKLSDEERYAVAMFIENFEIGKTWDYEKCCWKLEWPDEFRNRLAGTFRCRAFTSPEDEG